MRCAMAYRLKARTPHGRIEFLTAVGMVEVFSVGRKALKDGFELLEIGCTKPDNYPVTLDQIRTSLAWMKAYEAVGVVYGYD